MHDAKTSHDTVEIFYNSNMKTLKLIMITTLLFTGNSFHKSAVNDDLIQRGITTCYEEADEEIDEFKKELRFDLRVSFEENKYFSKNDKVDVFIDNELIKTISQGDTTESSAELSQGKHIVSFVIHGKEKKRAEQEFRLNKDKTGIFEIKIMLGTVVILAHEFKYLDSSFDSMGYERIFRYRKYNTKSHPEDIVLAPQNQTYLYVKWYIPSSSMGGDARISSYDSSYMTLLEKTEDKEVYFDEQNNATLTIEFDNDKQSYFLTYQNSKNTIKYEELGNTEYRLSNLKEHIGKKKDLNPKEDY